MDMSEVKAFNAELSGLYENKPPISKAKMSAITRGAIKAIKFYKHVVHSVEKFIQKCKPEYKVPGLYVIDSIVRQSRHQFGQDKDVFAPRFAKNMQQTFANLFRCPPEDKRNIIRVLNLWQKNHVFTAEVIQPLMDMADPNHPVHLEIQQNNTANGSTLNVSNSNSELKISPIPPSQHTPHNSTPGVTEQDQSNTQSGVKFNRKLLNDFEYESEDEAPHESLPPPQPQMPPQTHVTHTNPADALGSILTNPELMRQLQNLQAHMIMTGVQIPNMMPMVDMQMQQNQSQNISFLSSQNEIQKPAESKDEMANESDIEFVETGPQVIEIPDANDSRSPTPSRSRRHRGSRSKSPRSRSRRKSRTRSRSPSRKDRRRERDREREKEREREKNKQEREADKEKLREREKKGLPPIKKDNLSVCSTTLWVGHLSKLATPEELSDLFGEIGGVVSIDVVAPRGCAFVVMERRRDAAKALNKLNKYKLHSKEITVAWAPGKGVKGREWKDYWEIELGVSYLPWDRLEQQWHMGLLSMDALEEGGMVDEETLPPWLPPRMIPKAMLDSNMAMLPPPGLPPSSASIPLPNMANPGNIRLPANLPSSGPAGGLPMGVPGMPPPGMPAGIPPGITPGMPPGIRPPSIPANVPRLPADAGLPPTGPLLNFPPNMPPQSMPQPGMVGGFLGGLMGLGGMLPGMPPMHLQHHTPQPPHAARQQGQGQHQPEAVTHTDDAMDLDTEENQNENPPTSDSKPESNLVPPLSLPDQLQALLSKPPPIFNASEPPPNFNMNEPPPFNLIQLPPDEESKENSTQGDDKKNERDRDRDRDRRDRDRDRDRRDREVPDRRRDRDRDRDRRDKDRGRDRGDREREDRRDRDRDRDRDRGRDRRDRDRDRDRERFSSRDNSDRSRDRSPRTSAPNTEQNPEKTLQERLWEMANGKLSRPEETRPRQGDNYNNNGMDDSNDVPPRMDNQPPRLPDISRINDLNSRQDRPRINDLPRQEIQRMSDIPARREEMQRMNELPPRMEDMQRLNDMPRHERMLPRHDHLPPLLETPEMEKAENDGGWTQLPPPRQPPPHMAPTFRAELRMRGAPRPPLRGPWMEGPFGPRFNGMPFNRPPFERPPFEGGPIYDNPPRFERPPFNRMPFEGNRPPFDGNRPPFDGNRPPFDGNRPNFDGPNRPPFEPPRSFDGPRPPFEGPRSSFEGPPPFEGPPSFEDPDFDRPPIFDGQPEYFDRSDRRFDDRDAFNDRGGWNDRENRDRDWDRRQGGEWDEHRRDRRSRDHDDGRYNRDNRDRNDRRRNYEERRSSNRDDRNSRKERDRKSRWGETEDSKEQKEKGHIKEQDGNKNYNETVQDNVQNPREQAESMKSNENTQLESYSSSQTDHDKNLFEQHEPTSDLNTSASDINASMDVDKKTDNAGGLYEGVDNTDVVTINRPECESQERKVHEHNVHDTTDHNIHNATEHNVHNATEHNVDDATEHNVDDTIEQNVHDTIEDNVQDTIEHNIHDSIEHNIHDSIEHKIQDFIPMPRIPEIETPAILLMEDHQRSEENYANIEKESMSEYFPSTETESKIEESYDRQEREQVMDSIVNENRESIIDELFSSQEQDSIIKDIMTCQETAQENANEVSAQNDRSNDHDAEPERTVEMDGA